ncbi:hypothetical protein OZ71_gp081 [Staphylococcus phage MCE-2014]|uniref:Uncharacterized protein n=1 Tax=Staphylococcus phage MCE-2014 TaxID=1524910 RepID=A0A076G3Y4_9CAUD|nr:hypothetical protein OZ71_gp081 [Staphylococcus phage MCE-2014]AII26921.1 hypothetical protein [Staphylococcus phage MCE-2014]
MTIFFNKYQDAKEDKDRYQRLVEIYKKADDNDGETKKKYVKRLNKAEEELQKVKKETNYKDYNKKSNKERQKEDKETREKIYDVTGDDDLILVKNNIEFSDKVDKPEILISEDGIGTITVPVDSGYEKQTVGSIITSVLGSPFLSPDSNSIGGLSVINDNVYPNTVDSIVEDTNPSIDLPTDNPIITNPVEPTIPSDTIPPIDNPSVPVFPENPVDNNQGNTDNPNPPPPGYTDEDGGRGSGGGGNSEPPSTEEPSDNGNTGGGDWEEKPDPGEEPSDNGNTGGNGGEVTTEPEPEPEQPNENPDEGNEEKPSEPSDNPDENGGWETEPTEPESPSEPDDKVDEEDKNEDTTDDKQPTEQPDDNNIDNEDKTEEE